MAALSHGIDFGKLCNIELRGAERLCLVAPPPPTPPPQRPSSAPTPGAVVPRLSPVQRHVPNGVSDRLGVVPACVGDAGRLQEASPGLL